MKRIFSENNGCSIHYRQSGTGPALLFLHPSPRSSAMMEPLMRLLDDKFNAIAPDMPGYGLSSPLAASPVSLYDYVPALHQFIESVTDQPVVLYGSATGAQLAIAYALVHPQQVQQLYLDNCAHFDEAACRDILGSYFPDFSPKPDGSHLQAIWQHVCDSCLFFPWYDKQEANRIAAALPAPDILQGIVNDYLQAGVCYADAYRAAFLHERAEKVQQLQCPTTLFRWMGSPILRHIDRLLQFDLPANISVVKTPAPMPERMATMRKVILSAPTAQNGTET